MGDWQTWLLPGLVAAALASVSWLWRTVQRNEGRLEAVEKVLQRYEATEEVVGDIRVLTTRIDERVKHLPSNADLQQVHTRITKSGKDISAVAASVSELTAEMRGLRAAVDRLHDIETSRQGVRNDN